MLPAIQAPKLTLPTHAESYNPPEEYLLDKVKIDLLTKNKFIFYINYNKKLINFIIIIIKLNVWKNHF